MALRNNAHPIIAYSLYAKVWLILVLLTCLTVGVNSLDMKKFGIFAALLIAVTKATLVVLYFMHLRYEKLVYVVMTTFVLLTFSVFVFLTFSDYSFR